jgi:hypothetical protein
MTGAKWISYFRRAVLLTTTLPACSGGAQNTSNDAAVDVDRATPAAPGPPITSCDASPPSALPGSSFCVWLAHLNIDASACAELTTDQCAAACSPPGSPMTGGPYECVVYPGAAVLCTSDNSCCSGAYFVCNGGRRPAYFAALGFSAAPSGRELGTHFARAACIEAASVVAFRWLRDELVAHRAPKRLVRAASRAVRDEERHVRQTSALARRFGEEPIAPMPPPPRRVRPLLETALENAVQGCVRETYSTLECAWQARFATDPVVRTTMKLIARDELRHLALSWAVHGWAMAKLDSTDRHRVRGAQRDEIAALKRELSDDPHQSLVREGGLPQAFQSQALVEAIEAKIAA